MAAQNEVLQNYGLASLQAYVALRQAVIDSPSAPRKVIDAQDKAVQIARAPTRNLKFIYLEGRAPFVSAALSFAAFVVAMCLLCISWIRRFGEMPKRERSARWALVIAWMGLVFLGWALVGGVYLTRQ